MRIGGEQGFFGQYHRICTFLPVAVKILYQIIAAAEYVEQPMVAAAFDGLFGSGAVCGKMGDDLFSGNVDAACVCGRCAAAYRNIDGGSQADMAAETADAEADRASARAAGAGGEEEQGGYEGGFLHGCFYDGAPCLANIWRPLQNTSLHLFADSQNPNTGFRLFPSPNTS